MPSSNYRLEIELPRDDEVSVYFEYGKTAEGFTDVTPAQSLSSTGTFDHSISPLETGAEYQFRAVVETADGEVDRGETHTFTT